MGLRWHNLRASISLEAVFTGAVVDQAFSFFVITAFAVYYGFSQAIHHASLSHDPSVVAAQVIAAAKASPTFAWLGTLLGCLATVLGGYLAAKIAGRSEILNSTLASCGSVLLSMASLFYESDL